MATRKHYHKFTTFTRWIKTPWKEEDINYHWHFTVDAKCSCGQIGTRDATHTEVEDFITQHTCKECGKFNSESPHTSTSHCLKELLSRVDELERIIENIRDSMRSI